MRDLALFAVVIPWLALSLARPWTGVLGWSWIGMMNPHRLTWGSAYAFPFAAAFALATLIGLLVSKDRKAPPRSPAVLLMVFLLLYCLMTTFFAFSQKPAWESLEQFAKIILMTVVTTMLIFGRTRVIALVSVVAASIGYYGVKGGIFSVLTGGEFRVRGPAESFIGSNNDLGLALVMVITLILALAFATTRVWFRRALWAAAGLCAVSVLFTYSRGALLGLVAVAAFTLWASKRRLVLLLFSIAFGAFVVAFAPEKFFDRAETIKTYTLDESARLRFQSWSVGLNVALERPLIGGGFKLASLPDAVWVSYASPEWREVDDIARAAHSIYFQMLGEHGFVALAIYLWLLLWTYFTLRRLQRETTEQASLQWLHHLAFGLRAGLVGYAVAGTFLSSAYFDLFYLYVALAAILVRESKVEQKRGSAVVSGLDGLEKVAA